MGLLAARVRHRSLRCRRTDLLPARAMPARTDNCLVHSGLRWNVCGGGRADACRHRSMAPPPGYGSSTRRKNTAALLDAAVHFP